jgi:large subunit ribosomal protein L21e
MPSRCREDFLKRRVENDVKKAAAKAAGGKADTKRKPVGPRDGFVLPNVTAQTVTPLPYDILREGVKY